MRFAEPLFPGRLVKRYKRFLADIVLEDGQEITAHCANPGSMLGIAIEGARVWVSHHNTKKRKLPFSWEFVEIDNVLVPVNTTNPNKIVKEALNAKLIPEFTGYETVRSEVKYGEEGSRIDFLLSGGRRMEDCYLEVKNVHLSRQAGLAEFPDSVTVRGAKHLRELSRVKRTGARTVLLFVVQRGDCTKFSPAADLDSNYGAAFAEAIDAGVEALCYDCEITLEEAVLRKPLEMDLERL